MGSPTVDEAADALDVPAWWLRELRLGEEQAARKRVKQVAPSPPARRVGLAWVEREYGEVAR